MKRGLFAVVFLIMAACISISAFAANEISQYADRLNYYSTSQSHTVTVSNSGSEGVNITVTCPSDISFSSGSGCSSITATLYTCEIPGAGSASYTVTDSGSGVGEYTVSNCYVSSLNNSYTSQNNVSFLRVNNHEIFHTLVEYGRGRGNYFYDTLGAGVAGSGHTGSGCNYVPNATMFELNFLHKVLNVRQWYGDLDAEAQEAVFSCTYPNRTIVREHLITAIVTNSTGSYLDYGIDRISGAWERMGYLGMDFDSHEQKVGDLLYINCTNISYYLPIAGGRMVVDDDSFALEVRSREPFAAAASTSSTVGNGTQEVLILYNITNTEQYAVDDVIIEIKAPPYATFVGTRAELWGSARDTYRYEKAQMQSGEPVFIYLVARFDTSSAGAISSVNLTQGINLEYITCWEANAYNPGEYIQSLGAGGLGTATVNMALNSNIISLVEKLELIYNVTEMINSTVLSINSTVADINYMVDVINTTTQDTNAVAKAINQTVSGLLNQTGLLVNNTQAILNDTGFIIEQLDCDTVSDSPICDRVSELNNTLAYLWNITLGLNYTANNINATVVIENITGVDNISVNVDWTEVEELLYDVEEFLNCTNTTTQANESVCNRLYDIEHRTAVINNTIDSILSTSLYFNQSIFGSLTFQDIIDAINTTSGDTGDLLVYLQELRELDEEMIFLVTDSFGLQQQAKADFETGNFQAATQKLMEANLKLTESAKGVLNAQERLREEGVVTSAAKKGGLSAVWVWVALVIIAGAYFLNKPVRREVQVPGDSVSGAGGIQGMGSSNKVWWLYHQIEEVNNLIKMGNMVKARQKYQEILSGYSQIPPAEQARLYPMLKQLHKKL